MPNSPDLGFIKGIDWTSPDEVDAQGHRLFNVRCRVPFVAPTPGVAMLAERSANTTDNRVFDDDGDGVRLGPDATGDDGSDDEVSLGNPLVSGIASSTSVDFFGTEMSLRALKLMASQMKTGAGASVGIPYLPRHNNGMAGAVEWDSVIGRTVNAEVLPVEADQLQKPHNPAETQFMLRVTVMLFEDEPLAKALLRRVSPPPAGRGEAIGQSIGGWFTQLQIVQNEEGDVERVIVLGVELDHLAVTRAPANPDSMGIIALRSRIEESAMSHADTERRQQAVDSLSLLKEGHSVSMLRSVGDELMKIVEADENIDARHIVAAKETENTVVYQFLKGGATSDNLSEDELITKSEDSDEMEEEESRDAAEAADERAGMDDEDEESEDRGSMDPEDEEGMDEDEERSAVLDSTPSAAQDVDVTDAHRSALPTSSTPGTNSAEFEEPAMSDQTVSLDAIRSLLDEKLAPVTDRIAALESSEERAQPAPEPTPAPDPAAELRSQLEDANKRAERAEAAAAAMASRPFRVGRSGPLSIPDGPGAATVYDGLVQRARSEAPVLSAVAERMIPLMTEEKGAKATTRGQLLDGLTAMLNAAEADGVITDPAHRPAWQ